MFLDDHGHPNPAACEHGSTMHDTKPSCKLSSNRSDKFLMAA